MVSDIPQTDRGTRHLSNIDRHLLTALTLQTVGCRIVAVVLIIIMHEAIYMMNVFTAMFDRIQASSPLQIV